jgi:hypothetical protein
MSEQEPSPRSHQASDFLSGVADVLTPVSMEKRTNRSKWIEDFFTEYDTSIVNLSQKEQALEEQYRSKCYGMLPSELRKGALEQLDMGGRTVITQYALAPVTLGLSVLAAPPIASLYYNKKVDKYHPKELPKLTTTDWVLGTVGFFLVGTALNPLSVAGIRNYMRARSTLLEIKRQSGDIHPNNQSITKPEPFTTYGQSNDMVHPDKKPSFLPLTSIEQKKLSIEAKPATNTSETVKKFNTSFETKNQRYADKEQALQMEARSKLNGLLPEEFRKGAIKQTLLGLVAYVPSLILSPTIFGSMAIDAGTSIAYEYARKHMDAMKDMQGLSAFDWIVGWPIPGFLNPILVGGIRNLWKSWQVMRDIEKQKAV